MARIINDYNLFMRILFLCGREAGYTRNDVLLRAFQRFAKVTQVTDPDGKKSNLRRSVQIALRAVPELLKNQYDLVFVGFYGQMLMLPVGLLTRKPILFDAFVSTYDTLIEDRKIASSKSILARLAYRIDNISSRRASHILVDTDLHTAYFSNTFHLPIQKFSSLPVGCNESIFYPRPPNDSRPVARVLYYCTYLPLHGVDVVIRAAGLLKSLPVSFRLIGDGMEYPKARMLAEELELKNVEFVPPMPLEQIADEIALADIVLGGHFHTGDKAGRVVPGKVYQILASAKPVIASSSPANSSLLTHKENAYLCPAGSPEALADALVDLIENSSLQKRIAAGGRKVYEERCSELAITQKLEEAVRRLLPGC
jgi:glycosyltransferase involved in cell wall biosynthesis